MPTHSDRFSAGLLLCAAFGCAPQIAPIPPPVERRPVAATEKPSPLPQAPRALPDAKDCKDWSEVARNQSAEARQTPKQEQPESFARATQSLRMALKACVRPDAEPQPLGDLYLQFAAALTQSGARDDAIDALTHIIEDGERPLAKRARPLVAEVAKQTTDLERAQKAPKSALALHFEVVRLWLLAGEVSRAVDDIAYWKKRWGTNASTLELDVALANHYAQTGEWSQVVERLSDKAEFAKKGWWHTRAEAHALRGRALAAMNDSPGADAEYDAALALWTNADAAIERVAGEAANAHNAKRRMARALDAVGEAMFHRASREQAKLRLSPLPEYRGPNDTKAFREFLDNQWGAWAEEKKKRVDATTREYLLILELRPAAPRRWVIRASSAIGMLWARFAEELKKTPLPKQLAPARPTLQPLFDERRQALVDLDTRYATTAYETCLQYAVEFVLPLGPGEQCRQWLAARQHGSRTQPEPPEERPSR